MSHNYLLEIGLEDMPAHVVTPSLTQFAAKTADFLKAHRLDYDRINQFATPRRLTLQVVGLSEKQPDIEEEVKGPAKKIAVDEAGNWTKAAIGFTRGQGLTPEDITFREAKGVEYVYLHKAVAGQPAAAILPGLIDVIKSLTFPTRMRWGSYDFEYIRPVHWLVSLLDDRVVPLQLLDVEAGRRTQGHRFLGAAVDLADAMSYVDALREQKVLVAPGERKDLIRTQLAEIASANHWQIDPDADLLEEVNNLVEWPTAFAGRFDDKYLALPEAVLITSMKDNQRYFYATDATGQMVNAFIGVRNGNRDHLDNVIAGNVKVLTARLEDAAFFYAEDQKKTIAEFVARLDNVAFHDKIGSLAEKMARVTTIADVLAEAVSLQSEDRAKLRRAASIDKFDLVTAMVGEFAELQGVMGEVYANLFGEDPAVALAIKEHYQPIAADGALPASTIGTLLALADKLDSLMSFFAVDLIPSGSNDPYALRRQAYGIVRIIAKQHWAFDVNALQATIVTALGQNDQLGRLDYTKNQAALADFMRDRVSQYLNGESVRHDIIDAVVASPTVDVEAMLDAAQLLAAHQEDRDFKAVMEALGRVTRIAKKTPTAGSVAPALFENPTEHALHEAVVNLEAIFDAQPSEANYQALAALTAVITDYFDATMIMADDQAIQTNRLKELNALATLIHQFGDVAQVIVK